MESVVGIIFDPKCMSWELSESAATLSGETVCFFPGKKVRPPIDVPGRARSSREGLTIMASDDVLTAWAPLDAPSL